MNYVICMKVQIISWMYTTPPPLGYSRCAACELQPDENKKIAHFDMKLTKIIFAFLIAKNRQEKRC